MVEAFQWLIEHASGANWFEHIRDASDHDWRSITIMLLVFIGLINLASVINFIAGGIKESLSLFPFVPLVLGYFVINNLINIAVCIIGFSIGGFVGVLLIGLIYLILLCVSSWEDVQDYDPFEGLFRLSGWVIGYSDNYDTYKRYKKEVKEKYNQYLNLEY